MSEVLTDKEITMLWLNIHGHLAPPTDTKQAFARLIVAATLQKLNAHFDEWWSHSYTRALRAGLPKAPKN